MSHAGEAASPVGIRAGQRFVCSFIVTNPVKLPTPLNAINLFTSALYRASKIMSARAAFAKESQF